ncbi:MAG: metallophosphoesterase family protein [Candidatus Omnitrophica bacterium]|nr:metallophosphoesterase family protein [Candidatus Omnitrophota bacterium]
MRYGVVSDIHGNLEALKAVLGECRKLNVDSLLCCGDIAGYGADPKECLGLVRKLKAVAVAGNHDWAVSGKLDFSYFTPDGQAAVVWTRSHLAIEDIFYLNNLPLSLKNKDCTLVHGTLLNPQQFVYLTNETQAADTFALMDTQVCFVGHTHVPKVFIEREGNICQSDILDIELNAKYKYIVNLGSVGQPRDGNPLAGFCIYDTALRMIENHRVLYDINKAQQKILDTNLPETLALRLTRGE